MATNDPGRKLWMDDEVEKLAEAYRSEQAILRRQPKLGSYSQYIKKMWERISDEVFKVNGRRWSGEQCKTKVNNIIQQAKAAATEQNKSRTGNFPKPELDAGVEQMMAENATNPAHHQIPGAFSSDPRDRKSPGKSINKLFCLLYQLN